MSNNLRDQLRAKLLNSENFKGKRKTVKFFGQDVEVRQPCLEQIQKFTDLEGKNAVVEVIIEYCYVPGTDERIFEDADREALKQLPFDSGAQEIVNAITAFTDLSISEQEKN